MVNQVHLSQDLLHSIKLDHAWSIILFAQQSKGILDIDFFELVILLERENLQKLVEVDAAFLGKHVLELCLLFLVRLETHHLEDLVQAIQRDSILSAAWLEFL